MLSLGEKSLFQEGSDSGTSDPSHKGDSYSSFQSFKATYRKCLGWREAHLLTLPTAASVLQGTLTGIELHLCCAGDVNVMHTRKHSPLAPGGTFLHITCQCAVLGLFSTEIPQ